MINVEDKTVYQRAEVRMKSCKKEFTLIELLVVIAMMAITTNNCIIANFNNLS